MPVFASITGVTIARVTERGGRGSASAGSDPTTLGARSLTRHSRRIPIARSRSAARRRRRHVHVDESGATRRQRGDALTTRSAVGAEGIISALPDWRPRPAGGRRASAGSRSDPPAGMRHGPPPPAPGARTSRGWSRRRHERARSLAAAGTAGSDKDTVPTPPSRPSILVTRKFPVRCDTAEAQQPGAGTDTHRSRREKDFATGHKPRGRLPRRVSRASAARSPATS